MTGEADLLSSKFFWKNIYFSGLFREKHILFIPMIQGKTILFLKNSGKNIPENVYEPWLERIQMHANYFFYLPVFFIYFYDLVCRLNRSVKCQTLEC